MSDNLLLIYDLDQGSPLWQGDIAYWQSYSTNDSDKEVSISKMVEDDLSLRAEYLSFVYELGELKFDSERIIDYLELNQGFSYWWTTLFAEKCNLSKSPQINNAIKMMALKKWLIKKQYTKIKLATLSVELADSLYRLSLELSIDFELQEALQISLIKKIKNKTNSGFFQYFRALLWYAKHVATHWPLKGVGVGKWKVSKSKTTFISYLFNQDIESASKGKFKSQYWTTLPDLLNQQLITTNWLHIYVKDKKIPTASKAKNIIQGFNKKSENNQTHVVLHSFLNVKLSIKTFREWTKLRKKSEKLEFFFESNCGYLWPFLKKDFELSFYGPSAIKNVLFVNLFENAMSLLPKQEAGYYLQENQAWEAGLVNSWRSFDHDYNLIGVPHATVRYWDLRYFFDKRVYDSKLKNGAPLPDFIAINGNAAHQMYLDSEYDEDKLLKVEALRYLYLESFKKNCTTKNNDRILVFGDYDPIITSRQMNLLQKSNRLVNNNFKYIVKPHPACEIFSSDYPELDMVISNEPVSDLLEKYMIVYIGNVTSAAVDAYYADSHIITYIDPNLLNLSPLRNVDENIIIVHDANELAHALEEVVLKKTPLLIEKDYFYIDTNLPKWKGVIHR